MNQKTFPYQQWYWRDWFGDQEVRLLSPVDRCIWFEMIGIMWQSSDRGYLLIGGKRPTHQTICKIIGVSEEDFSSAIDSLRSMNVFSETEDGVFYSRRILRDLKKSEIKAESGRKGAEKRYSKDSAIAPAMASAIAPVNHVPLLNGYGYDNEVLSLDNTSVWNSRHMEFLTAGPPCWMNYELQSYSQWKSLGASRPNVDADSVIASAKAFKAYTASKGTKTQYITKPQNFIAQGAYGTDWEKEMSGSEKPKTEHSEQVSKYIKEPDWAKE